MSEEGKCSSCGRPWVDHMGIQSTCAELKEALYLIRELLPYAREEMDRCAKNPSGHQEFIREDRETIRRVQALLSKHTPKADAERKKDDRRR